MHIHIIGICGTFMGGLAVIAKSMGHTVSGSDADVYPPMSTQLSDLGIVLYEGYCADNLKPEPDLVAIGNALSRGNAEVEAVLDRRLAYTSGAQWLYDYVLNHQWVLAVSGTHGKTTTSAMLAWVLDYAGIDCGFLVGGVLANFGVSARLGSDPFFVIEADEYDCAFFDKRSKFMHYRPQSLLINNLEFDHADIFDTLADIQKQFHHLVRTVPSTGLIVYPKSDANIEPVLGGWSETETIGGDWDYRLIEPDGSMFDALLNGKTIGTVRWDLIGLHNVSNALGALALARHTGIAPVHAIEALATFKTPKRRMELIGQVAAVRVYDDFAHHPTAIKTTLAGLRAKIGADKRLVAVLEPRSNTMKAGAHKSRLADALADADLVFVYQDAALDWSVADVLAGGKYDLYICDAMDDLLDALSVRIQKNDEVLIMSNGSFGGIHQQLLDRLARRDNG